MRISSDEYYQPTDPALRILGAVQTLARWRHEGKGPAYTKAGNRVLYSGEDILIWLDRNRLDTSRGSKQLTLIDEDEC